MSGESYGRIGFCVGKGWRVDCYTYDDTTPILDIRAGSTSVAVSLRGQAADEAAVEFARALADEARKFADEVERIHAARLNESSTDKAAGSNAA